MDTEVESITIIVPKRQRRKNEDLGKNEHELKISDLNRRLYYLKKYGLEIIPEKRKYVKKAEDFTKLKVKKEKIVLNFS